MSKSKAEIKPAFYDIIRKPLITEKSTIAGENHKATFQVSVDATKPQIAEAVESLFNVDVRAVNVMNVKGKQKRFRGKLIRRPLVKKAIVTLKDGQTIDIMAGV